MELREGQIYKGNISLSGGNDGPTRCWIIVAPFGRTHIHSIDNPLDLHCWPIFAAHKGLEEGTFKLVKTDCHHPVIHLQRAKEEFDIRDAAMGLHGESLHKMLALLEQAVMTGESYAPFAAGEILALIDRAQHSDKETELIKEQVDKHLRTWEWRRSPPDPLTLRTSPPPSGH